VGVGVDVGVAVAVGMAVGVDVAVGGGVAVAVGVAVAEGTGVCVVSSAGVGVGVGAGVIHAVHRNRTAINKSVKCAVFITIASSDIQQYMVKCNTVRRKRNFLNPCMV